MKIMSYGSNKNLSVSDMCQTKEIFAPWTYLSLIIKPNPLKNISILNIYIYIYMGQNLDTIP